MRPLPSAKRFRSTYEDSKKQPLAGTSTSSFLASTAVEVTAGYFSLFEDLLLKSILFNFFMNGIELSAEKLHHSFMLIYMHARKFTINFHMLERSIKEVERFIKNVLSTINFLQLTEVLSDIKD